MADRDSGGSGGTPAATWLLVAGGVLTVLGLLGLALPGPGLLLLCPGLVLLAVGAAVRVTAGKGRV